MIALCELRVPYVDNRWVKHALGCGDSLALVHLDDLTAWQLVGTILLGKVVVPPLHLSVVVHGNVAHSLLNVSDLLEVGHVHWGARSLQFRDQLVRDFLSSNFNGLHSVGEGVTFENWHSVGDSLTTLSDQTSSCTVRE
jgi:hypothetical protein